MEDVDDLEVILSNLILDFAEQELIHPDRLCPMLANFFLNMQVWLGKDSEDIKVILKCMEENFYTLYEEYHD